MLALPVRARSAEETFAHFVPARVEILVVIEDVGGAQQMLEQVGASSALSMLLPASLAHEGAFDLRVLVRSAFGLEEKVTLDALDQVQVALAIPSSDALEDAVWMMRVPETKLADRWFVPADLGPGGHAGPARFFVTGRERMVARRDRFVAIGTRWGVRSLFSDVLTIMAGRDEPTLANDDAFERMTSFFPADPLAKLYFGDLTGDASLRRLAQLMGGPENAVVGLYAQGGLLDVAIRGTFAAPDARRPLTADAVARFVRLPLATVLATVHRVDLLDHSVEPDGFGEPAGLGLRSLLSMLLRPVLRGRGDAPLGDQLIFAVGPDFREGPNFPQVAAMIECRDEVGVAARMEEVEAKLLSLLGHEQPSGQALVSPVQARLHLGASVRSIRPYLESRSTMPVLHMLERLEPSWTIWNGWLIVTLSPDFLFQVLDAQVGLAPTMNLQADVQRVVRGARTRSSFTVVQPQMAAQMIDAWLATQPDDGNSIFHAAFWSDTVKRGGPSLGIGMRTRQVPGEVKVLRVYPGTLAHERLVKDDVILGLDGKLLSLTKPNNDLRRLWRNGGTESASVFRVVRGGKQISVRVERQEAPAMMFNMPVSPRRALQELVEIGNKIQTAAYVVDAADPRQFASRLTLRFTRKASGVQSRSR